MAESTTRTVYGSALQTSQLLGIPYQVLANSTLNERFNVEKTAVIPDGQYPRLGYFCIGTGGVKLTAGADGRPRTELVQHRSTDVSCFDPLPFILRPLNNDLSASERLKYGLRTQETYNGNVYVAYYLKRIDMSQVQVKIESRTINNGIVTSVPFTPNNSNLTPTPPVTTNTGANILNSEYVTCTAQLVITLSQQECEELLDVCIIKYGSEDYAIISEIGLCSGVDKMISITGGGSFKEAIGVQIVSHINTWHAVQYAQAGITGTFDIGVADPLWSIA
jgi:hypothetical protein